MIVSPAPADPRTAPSGLAEKVRLLIGEPFLFSRTSYGGERVLYFGRPLVDEHPLAGGRTFVYDHATYSLHFRASAWAVKSNGVVATGGMEDVLPPEPGHTPRPLDPAAERRAMPAPGAVVLFARPFPIALAGFRAFGLRLELSDGSAGLVAPTAGRPEDHPAVPAGVVLDEIADWELVTPEGELAVGPGPRWRWEPAAAGRDERTDERPA